jgi:hypothetical protein
MNAKQRKTLAAIFETPTKADLRWTDVESMLKAAGAGITEGHGARVRVLLNDVAAVFHRPHPRPIMDKGTVESVRRFLTRAGVTP